MSHTLSKQILSCLSNCVCIVNFYKERNGSVDVMFVIKNPKLKIKMHSIQTGSRETDEFVYLLDGKKKNLSILSKLLLGWLHLMPLYKISKKFYSNNPPCSKKLRKLGSFLYMDHLFFKEGTKRLRYLKSFMSYHGKFIYTNTCMWWVHVTITEYLFLSFLPIPPHR